MQLRLINRPLTEAIFYQQGRPITGGQLLAHSALLAAELTEVSAVINLADNRLDFALGFLAALIAGKTTILPANNKLATLQGLMSTHPKAQLLVSSLQPWPFEQTLIAAPDSAEAPAGGGEDFRLAADFTAVTVYTSGSTGAPKANSKSWRALVHTAQKLYARFAQAGALSSGSYVMGTVPSQHMYGLEMLVMLPFTSPVTSLVEGGLLPEDLVASAQRAPQPVVLVSSPIHLSALAQQAHPWGCFAGVISATAPLEQALAEQIEQRHGLGVWEIYGCTEAGSMATRRTQSREGWRFLPGITPVPGGQAVDVDHLQACIPLQDELHWQSDGSFILGQRSSDLIKIGGKRGSLAQITARIKQHPQVRDAYVFVSSGKIPRLLALVCGQVSAYELKQFIAQHSDDVFVPRLIRFTEQLPRNANGKIIHADAWDLWRRLDTRSAQAENPAGEFNARQVRIPATHPIFSAHFPGQPLLPAALILSWLAEWLAETNLHLIGVKTCKFIQPILPGDELTLAYKINSPRLQVKLIKAGASVLEGQFTLAAPHVE